MGAGQEGAAGARAEVGGVRADCQDAPRHGRLGLLWGSSSISHKPVGCVVMTWMSLIVTARMAIDLSREGGSVRKGCAVKPQQRLDGRKVGCLCSTGSKDVDR